jgi:betaine-aldehyde dehydrogenase
MNLTATDYSMLIGGTSTDSADGNRFSRESPAHDVIVGTYPSATGEDVDRAVAAARVAFDTGPWPRESGATRARVLRGIAELIDANSDRLAFVEATESGKPIAQARGEMQSTAELWMYAATLAQHAYGDAHNALGSQYLGLTFREPLGVVGAITPWNFPLLIASQKVPFALAVGCTVVVKPSELTPGTTVILAELAREAGLPDGALNVITGAGDVGARLAEHPDIDMISFTGSTDVGSKVMTAAAKTLKRVGLELGGKNPQVVMADGDLDAAIDAIVFGVYFNQGECCNSSSRVLVHESIADELTARVVERSRHVLVGDPLDESTLVGAIINSEQLATIERLVGEGKEDGADLLLGGDRRATPVGRFYEPTVFANVTPTMSIARDEIFGPVLSTIRFRDLDEAINIANSTAYGLSAGVWTSDLDAALTFTRGVRAGTIWVNCWMDGFPELSFGGYKRSGIGRELGRHAIEEFTELKTVTVHTGPRTMWVSTGGAE